MSQVIVLCYHAVSSNWPAALSVTPESLRSQLRKLVRRGWRGVTFSEAVLGSPNGRTLAVTFDDAFLSVLERARPILQELGLPATVFVPTGFVEHRVRLQWPGIEQWATTEHADELTCMNWDDLSTLQAAGWEIGSHTRTHPRLSQLDDDALRSELEASRLEVQQRLERPCSSLAYPYGDVDERVAAAVREAGYRCAAGLSSSLAELGPYRWPRIGIYHSDTGFRYSLKASRAMRAARASSLWPAHE